MKGCVAPVLGLLALAACGGEPAGVGPPPTVRAAPPGAGPGDFDRFLDGLAGGGATSAAAQRPLPPAPVSYRENLAVCLDGRLPAFCDHGRLTAHDAARVRRAEHEANLVTCIDPAWQHLCRPDLLPDAVP